MHCRPPTAAPPRKLAYTQSAQYTHPPLFPIFRGASAPRTEVIGVQLPHQTDGSLMRGVEAAPLSYSGGHPPLGEENAFPASPLPKIPPTTTRQGREHVSRRGSTIAGRRGWQRAAGIVLLCEQLKACQMEIQHDRTKFDFSRFLLPPPAGLVTSRVTLGTSLNALAMLAGRRWC